MQNSTRFKILDTIRIRFWIKPLFYEIEEIIKWSFRTIQSNFCIPVIKLETINGIVNIFSMFINISPGNATKFIVFAEGSKFLKVNPKTEPIRTPAIVNISSRLSFLRNHLPTYMITKLQWEFWKTINSHKFLRKTILRIIQTCSSVRHTFNNKFGCSVFTRFASAISFLKLS